MTNPYINDSRDNYDQVKEERKKELEEVRKSFAEKKENYHFNLENSDQVCMIHMIFIWYICKCN